MNTSDIICQFGLIPVHAMYVNDTRITCITPAYDYLGDVLVTITTDLANYTVTHDVIACSVFVLCHVMPHH